MLQKHFFSKLSKAPTSPICSIFSNFILDVHLYMGALLFFSRKWERHKLLGRRNKCEMRSMVECLSELMEFAICYIFNDYNIGIIFGKYRQRKFDRYSQRRKPSSQVQDRQHTIKNIQHRSGQHSRQPVRRYKTSIKEDSFDSQALAVARKIDPWLSSLWAQFIQHIYGYLHGTCGEVATRAWTKN